MVHMIGHSLGAWTHAPHGYTLASVSMAYYRRAMEKGLPKFVRFARNVFEKTLECQANRLASQSNLTSEQLSEITIVDLPQ